MGFLSFFFPYKNGHAAIDSCQKKKKQRLKLIVLPRFSAIVKIDFKNNYNKIIITNTAKRKNIL